MKRRESQERKIMRHLNLGRTITALQAFTWFGCQRLASRINRLNDPKGKYKFPTMKRMVKTASGARVAQYRKG